jgi:hypothetical protein
VNVGDCESTFAGRWGSVWDMLVIVAVSANDMKYWLESVLEESNNENNFWEARCCTLGSSKIYFLNIKILLNSL